MPETAVNDDHLAPSGKDEVGRAGQVAAMRAEAVAHAVDQAADGEFGPRVLPANAGHAFGAF